MGPPLSFFSVRLEAASGESSFIGSGSAVVILQKRVPRLSREALERFVLRARRTAGIRGSADVLITGSETMRALNQKFRGKNYATDVLSFPVERKSLHQTAGSKNPRIGEIAISAEIAMQNAARFGHSAAEEIKILTLHGILHLAGFDHERDNGQMARRELRLRQALGLPVALIERSKSAQPKSVQGSSVRALKAPSLRSRV